MTAKRAAMNRILLSLIIMTWLAGCEMAGQARNATTEGASAFSCEQIRAAFAAYEADRTSFEALAEVSGMTGFDFTQTASQTADVYYERALNSANLALIVKGCEPL